METLIEFINSVYPISDALKIFLLKHLKTVVVAKKNFLLSEGHISNKIYFIEHGIFRGFYSKGDKDISSWFMKEGDVIISIESFFMQKKSLESIQAIEDSVVHYISYDQLQFIYKEFIEFNFVGRVLLEKYYCQSEQRSYLLRMQKASKKYNMLMASDPELIQRVPSMHLASYLGITLETLSRMKKLSPKSSVV